MQYGQANVLAPFFENLAGFFRHINFPYRVFFSAPATSTPESFPGVPPASTLTAKLAEERPYASGYLLVTECGFGELAKLRFPKKNFIAMCRLCPYMKSITLESVLAALRDPSPKEVTVPAEIAAKAKVAIDRMFELAA